MSWSPKYRVGEKVVTSHGVGTIISVPSRPEGFYTVEIIHYQPNATSGKGLPVINAREEAQYYENEIGIPYIPLQKSGDTSPVSVQDTSPVSVPDSIETKDKKTVLYYYDPRSGLKSSVATNDIKKTRELYEKEGAIIIGEFSPAEDIALRQGKAELKIEGKTPPIAIKVTKLPEKKGFEITTAQAEHIIAQEGKLEPKIKVVETASTELKPETELKPINKEVEKIGEFETKMPFGLSIKSETKEVPKTLPKSEISGTSTTIAPTTFSETKIIPLEETPEYKLTYSQIEKKWGEMTPAEKIPFILGTAFLSERGFEMLSAQFGIGKKTSKEIMFETLTKQEITEDKFKLGLSRITTSPVGVIAVGFGLGSALGAVASTTTGTSILSSTGAKITTAGLLTAEGVITASKVKEHLEKKEEAKASGEIMAFGVGLASAVAGFKYTYELPAVAPKYEVTLEYGKIAQTKDIKVISEKPSVSGIEISEWKPIKYVYETKTPPTETAIQTGIASRFSEIKTIATKNMIKTIKETTLTAPKQPAKTLKSISYNEGLKGLKEGETVVLTEKTGIALYVGEPKSKLPVTILKSEGKTSSNILSYLQKAYAKEELAPKTEVRPIANTRSALSTSVASATLIPSIMPKSEITRKKVIENEPIEFISPQYQEIAKSVFTTEIQPFDFQVVLPKAIVKEKPETELKPIELRPEAKFETQTELKPIELRPEAKFETQTEMKSKTELKPKTELRPKTELKPKITISKITTIVPPLLKTPLLKTPLPTSHKAEKTPTISKLLMEKKQIKSKQKERKIIVSPIMGSVSMFLYGKATPPKITKAVKQRAHLYVPSREIQMKKKPKTRFGDLFKMR